MAIKKVVGLQNLKDFYNELKNVFVLNPKDEGKTFLWTTSNSSEGYSKDEVDIKLKNLTINGENNSKNFNDYFLNQTYKFGTTAFNRDQYNFYYLDENNEYRIATDDLITKWSQEGTLADKTFYFNDIASRTLTPTMVINNVLSTVSNSLDLIVGSKMMVPYNWQSNSDGSFALLEKTYPDYFTYYREITDNDTLENVLYNQYKKIDSNTEAETLGATTKIYTQRPSIDEVDTIVDKKLLNIINTNPNFLSKGDLISMDLDGNGSKQYRVLKMDGNIAECIAMYAYNTSTIFGSSQTYAASTLDVLLNTTFYNTLTTTAKSAIMEKNIIQYGYDINQSIYNSETHCSYADYSTKTEYNVVGNRYIYALDVEDIEMYFGGTGGTASNNSSGIFNMSMIRKLFANTTGTELVNLNILLRSSVPSSSLKHIWYCTDYIKYGPCSDVYEVRPAFTIDLSKISFTKIN